MDLNRAYHLITQKLTLWLHEFIRLLPNFFIAAIILAVGLFISSRIKRWASGFVSRSPHSSPIKGLIVSTINILFIGITVFTALSILKLDKAVTSILAGAGIVGLALAFAFQDIAANFISGIFISFRKPMQLNDIVKIKDYMGKVEEINLRDTVLRTFQGQMVIIPNKDVFQNPIENYSLLGKRRIDLVIGISYGDDLEKAREVTLEAVKDLSHLSKDDETTLFYQEFGDSSINFVIRLWVNTPEQPAYMNVRSEAIIRIKKAYDASGIMIPFPIRTLDFGIKGGVQLAEMPVHIVQAGKSPKEE